MEDSSEFHDNKRGAHDHHRAVQHEIVRRRAEWGKIVSTTIAATLALNGLGRRQEAAQMERTPVAVTTTTSGIPPHQRSEDPKIARFADRVASEKSERVSVAIPPEKIGVLIDMKAEDLDKSEIFLENTQDGNIAIKAVPFFYKEQSQQIYVIPGFDPLSKLSDAADSTAVKQAIDEWIAGHRQLESTDINNSAEKYPNKRYITIPTIEYDRDRTVPLAETKFNSNILLRVDLGTESSPQMQWLQRISVSSRALLADIDVALNNSADSMATFLKDALINPHTQKFDNNAKETLYRLFSLTPEDRIATLDALKFGDISRAKEILTFRSTQPPFPEDIFQAIIDYKQHCNAENISAEDALQALIFARSVLTYDELARNTDVSIKETKIFAEHINAKQYAELDRMPLHLFTVAMNTIFNASHRIPYYQEVNTAIKEAISGPQDKFNNSETHYQSPSFFPQHTLDAINARLNLPDLTGTGASNWFDRRDRYSNMLSLIGLIEARSAVVDTLQETSNILDNLIYRANGRYYATLAIDTTLVGKSAAQSNDENTSPKNSKQKSAQILVSRDNYFLGLLYTIIRSANLNIALPTASKPSNSNIARLYNEINRVFATLRNDAFVISPAHLRQLAKTLGEYTQQAINPDILKEIFATEASDLQLVLTPPKTGNELGFTIHDIMGRRGVEAEVKLPSAGTGR